MDASGQRPRTPTQEDELHLRFGLSLVGAVLGTVLLPFPFGIMVAAYAVFRAVRFVAKSGRLPVFSEFIQKNYIQDDETGRPTRKFIRAQAPLRSDRVHPIRTTDSRFILQSIRDPTYV